MKTNNSTKIKTRYRPHFIGLSLPKVDSYIQNVNNYSVPISKSKSYLETILPNNAKAKTKTKPKAKTKVKNNVNVNTNIPELVENPKYTISTYSANNYSVPYSSSKSYIEIIPKIVINPTTKKPSNVNIFKFAKYPYRTIIKLYYEILEKYYKLKNKKFDINKCAEYVCDYTFEIAMKKLYDNIGNNIEQILNNFMLGINESNFETNAAYKKILDNLYLDKTDNKLFIQYKQILTTSIEGIQKNGNNLNIINNEYQQLLELYNILKTKIIDNSIISATTEITVLAEIKPEITEYIRRGYSLIDNSGNLIPINQDVITQIKIDLQIS